MEPKWIIDLENSIAKIRKLIAYTNVIIKCKNENKFTKHQLMLKSKLQKKFGSTSIMDKLQTKLTILNYRGWFSQLVSISNTRSIIRWNSRPSVVIRGRAFHRVFKTPFKQSTDSFKIRGRMFCNALKSDDTKKFIYLVLEITVADLDICVCICVLICGRMFETRGRVF